MCAKIRRGVVFGVPVDVAPVGFDLVGPTNDGPVVRPDALHLGGLIDRYPAVRHKANHTSKPYSLSTTDGNPMETKVMAERVGFAYVGNRIVSHNQQHAANSSSSKALKAFYPVYPVYPIDSRVPL